MNKPIGPKIVLLGGGTGSFTLLQALKKLTPNITAIVNMSDDGGSTGVLRDELGVLPPGDARQCLVALSESPEVRELFSYRFADGTLSGHTVGNLILSALEKQHGSFEKAVAVASRILRVSGRVLPVMLGSHTLVLQDGERQVRGEDAIGHVQIQHRGATIRLEPTATLNPQAREAIAAADLVVIAPGSLYTSLLPLFVVGGMPEAIRTAKGKVVSVTNLVTEAGQTDGWHVADYVKEIERYLGPGTIDYALYNDAAIDGALLKKYAAEGEYTVATDRVRFGEVSATVIGDTLISATIPPRNPADKAVRRTYIRHDADRVAAKLIEILRA